MAKRKQSRKSKMGIIVAVLLLAVGFAAVTTTLYINGTITIKPDTADFEQNVQFASASLATTNEGTLSVTLGSEATRSTTVTDAVSELAISEDGKTISFTTEDFDTIGQVNTLTYTVSNKSQYDAKLNDLTCAMFTAAQDLTIASTDTTSTTKDKIVAAAVSTNSEYVASSNYISVVPANGLSGKTIAAKTGVSSEDSVVITDKQSYADTENKGDITYYVYCYLPVDAVEATAAASSN